MISDFLKLSSSSLRKRKLRSWLTMIGIFIGIAAVVALISMGQGLKDAVSAQFSGLAADQLRIQNSGTGFGPPGSTAVNKLTEHDLQIIQSVPGVEIAISRLIRILKVEYNGEASFQYAADIPEDRQALNLIYNSNFQVEEGRLLNPEDRGKIVIGESVADSFSKKLQVGTKVSLQGKQFEIVGILKKSSSFQTNMVVFISNKDLKNLLNIGDEIDLIVAQVDGKNVEQIAEKIKIRLRRDRSEKEGEEDFSVQTSLQSLSSVNSILDIVNLVVTGIAAISLIIGGIGIMNTMYTSVLERTREIGTMKAVGARNKDILYIFVIESGMLGLVGGVIGAAIGLGLAFAASGIANAAFGTVIISAKINYYLLLGAVLFSFLIGVFSGLFPAMQASKLKPVDALRS